MRLRWPSIVVLAFVLVVTTPSMARLNLSREEREIVGWSQPTSAALIFNDSLSNLTIAEEMTRRAVLLARCPDFREWGSPVRFTNPKYTATMRESVRLFEQLLADDAKAEGTLPNDWSVAAIHAWRSWNESQRQSWMAFMRSSESRPGYELTQTIAALVGFKQFAVDRNSGALNLLWPAWLREFLIKARFAEAFREAANTVEAGLGDRFDTEAARPAVHPVDEAQIQSLSNVIKRLEKNWLAVATAMMDRLEADPANTRAAQSWLDQRQAQEIDTLASSLWTNQPSGVSASLLAESGRDATSTAHRRQALMRFLQAKAGSLCGTLQ